MKRRLGETKAWGEAFARSSKRQGRAVYARRATVFAMEAGF
jgi:hypothetical protein